MLQPVFRILAVENIEDTFPIPIEYVNNDEVFMLRVKGDSMIEAGIFRNKVSNSCSSTIICR